MKLNVHRIECTLFSLQQNQNAGNSSVISYYPPLLSHQTIAPCLEEGVGLLTVLQEEVML